MAVIKAVSSGAPIKSALDYVTKEEKTDEKLVSGIRCNPETAFEEMQATKELWDKTEGRTYKHFVHSYHKDEQISPQQAHKNALELAESTPAFAGHEILVATHIDKGHIHSHIIVNSVNLENGYKLQWSKADLQDMKDRCNEQSREQGLHVPEKGRTFSSQERDELVCWDKNSYKILKRAELGESKSYVQDIALAVMKCRDSATSKEAFIEQMKEKGYGVDWQDTHKYITFTDLARQEKGEKQCKVRNNKLEKYYAVDFGKEQLEHGFKVNLSRAEQSRELGRVEARYRAVLHTANDDTRARRTDNIIEKTSRFVAEKQREAVRARELAEREQNLKIQAQRSRGQAKSKNSRVEKVREHDRGMSR